VNGSWLPPAQPLVRYVGFTASVDHDRHVISYRVEFFPAGADPASATPLRVLDIGKPTPLDRDITVDVAGTVETLPPGTYFVTVSAVGVDRSSRSTPSETFVR